MKRTRENKGVTLIALVITIIVLMIIAGITINTGKESIKQAKLESLRTNMLLIQAKAKEYVEEATFKMGKDRADETETQREARKATVRQEVYITNGNLAPASGTVTNAPAEIPVSECYVVTQEALSAWGLDKIEPATSKGEYYLIKFDETNYTAEIYNTIGYEGKYSLTDIDNLE